MSWLRIGLALLVLAGSGCEQDAALLAVDLRTDLAPAVDFDAVTLTMSQGSREERVATPVDLEADYLAGARIAEIEDIADGDATLELAVIRDGATVITQPVRVRLRGSQLITIVITRSCRRVTCPTAAAPEAIACLGGVCVRPECASSETAECVGQCTAASDCPLPSASCAEARCIEGTCFAAGDDARCAAGEVCDADRGCRSPSPDAGGFDGGAVDGGVDGDGGLGDAGPRDTGPPPPPDTGPPPDAGPGCECVPAMVEMDTMPCGACGTSTRTRTCAADCRWESWSGFGACSGEGECTPAASDTEMRPCGACGGSQARSRTCTSSCTWGAFDAWSTCSEASCAGACGTFCPGDSGDVACAGPGGFQTCTCRADGTWGACGGLCRTFCSAS